MYSLWPVLAPWLWISPVGLFAGLIATQRLGAVPAAALALASTAAIIVTTGPRLVGLDELAMMLVAGSWVALPAVAVILAGLLFAEINTRAAETVAGHAVTRNRSYQLGTTCLFAGPFLETATGFGVGFVVALRGVMAFGIAPAYAISLAALSQCLVPWGALGVGTRISAAIVDMPLDDILWRAAVVTGPILLLTGLTFWRIAARAGFEASTAQKLEDASFLVLLAGLLYMTSRALPIELAGLSALGPVLLLRLWRGYGIGHLVSRGSIVTVLPYLALIFLLGLMRMVPPVTDALDSFAYTPGHGAPALAPLLSPAVPLAIVAIVAALVQGSGKDFSGAARRTLQKGWRACVLTIFLVVLAWLLMRSDIASAVVAHLGLGAATGGIVPVLGAIGGYLTGSNTGAGSLSMPVAAALSSSGGAIAWTAAAAVVAGSLWTTVSPVRMAMGQALAGAKAIDVSSALRMLLPYAGSALIIAVSVTLTAM